MPAEWAPHAATWISWPHNRETWPGNFDPVEPVMVQAVRALAMSEPVYVNVLGADHEMHVRGLFGRVPDGIRFFHVPTNDAWCRDHGATFLVRADGEPGLACADWRYNAWGGKYPPYDLDDLVAARMADILSIPRYRAEFVLEGGAIEVNGRGVVMTTASCVLNPNRNPGWTREDAELRLWEWLGVESVLWVEGDLEGDDTDGHIDNLARFVSPTDIVMTLSRDPGDPHTESLRPAFDRLRRDADRLGLSVHPLALPRPVHYDGRRLPASHANFYIGNTVILLPTYGGPSDDQAADLLSRFFPERTVVGIDCTELVWGLGAFHCLTQQVPLQGP
jgi:agmatine deiminase